VTAAAPAVAPIRLDKLPFFEGFDPAFLAAIAPFASERSYDAGVGIVREGDIADAFYLILSGKVALEVVLHDRPRRTIQTIGPNEVLGWSWLIPPSQWRLDARTVKATRLVSIDAARLRTSLNENPVQGYKFLLRLLPVIAERLENTRVQLLDIHAP